MKTFCIDPTALYRAAVICSCCIGLTFGSVSPSCLAQTSKGAEGYFQRALSESRELPTQEQAVRDFDSAIKLSPGTTKYYANKAELLFVLEEDEAALAAADKAIKLDPKCELAWYAKAKAQGRLKRPEEALKSINVVLSLSPKDALTLETRARLYVVQNRWQEAEKDLDQALNLSAGLISAYNDRINVCQHLKQWSKVVSDCTACLKIQTDHPGRMLQSRARAYAALHDYAKAVDDLKQAVKIWPDDIKVHRELEAVYKAMGDQKGQAMEAEKIKSLNRDY